MALDYEAAKAIHEAGSVQGRLEALDNRRLECVSNEEERNAIISRIQPKPVVLLHVENLRKYGMPKEAEGLKNLYNSLARRVGEETIP